MKTVNKTEKEFKTWSELTGLKPKVLPPVQSIKLTLERHEQVLKETIEFWTRFFNNPKRIKE
jgi:hypothetical protein